MSNNLMLFEGHDVEVFEINGMVYFNPYHVGECLGIAKETVRYHLTKMNNKQAVKFTNSDVGLANIRKLNNAGEKFLTESGVYKIAFKSEKPEAEKFTDWVTDEVLPSIRQTGAYISEKANTEALKENNQPEKLETINKSVELVSPLLDVAGVDNTIKLLVVKTLFSKAGVDIPIEIEAREKFYDTKQIAKMVGMYSKTGNPAFGAVGQIIKKLDIEEHEKEVVWESSGSWQGTVIKYTESVSDKVNKWLKENGYPVDIPSKNKTFHVVYKPLREVAI
ncbi:BRO-N domain-containing protein [Clostridium kluyveri]|nr:BRO family protein [Clostridium kluyveri]